jgi:hypothetical protein
VTGDRRHSALLRFISKLVDVSAGYSKDEIVEFLNIAERQYPSLIPVMVEYLHLAERSDTGVSEFSGKRSPARRSSGTMHLFDLLREKRLFPRNSDLSEFAGRIVPNMDRRRFDKMSRGDIAARIIEYLETLSPRTRRQLEDSMREAMNSGGTERRVNRKSFLSKWERIIKGMEL